MTATWVAGAREDRDPAPSFGWDLEVDVPTLIEAIRWRPSRFHGSEI